MIGIFGSYRENTMSAKNKNTILILVALILVFFYKYYQPELLTPVPKNDNVIVVPDPIPEPSPEVEKGCDLSLTKALQTDKKLLIIFVADWCGYCKSLKKDLFDMPSIDNYVVCLADIDNELNKDIVKHFRIKMLPTSIIVDPEAHKEIKRITGYNKEKYTTWIK